MEEDYRSLEIDEANLSKEMAEQPAKFMRVCEMYCRAMGNYDVARHKQKGLYAMLDGEIRDKARQDGEKITEKAIEFKIEVNPTYSARSAETIRLKVQMEITRGLKESWHMRNDSIQAMARSQREERYQANTTTLSELAGK